MPVLMPPSMRPPPEIAESRSSSSGGLRAKPSNEHIHKPLEDTFETDDDGHSSVPGDTTSSSGRNRGFSEVFNANNGQLRIHGLLQEVLDEYMRLAANNGVLPNAEAKAGSFFSKPTISASRRSISTSSAMLPMAELGSGGLSRQDIHLKWHSLVTKLSMHESTNSSDLQVLRFCWQEVEEAVEERSEYDQFDHVLDVFMRSANGQSQHRFLHTLGFRTMGSVSNSTSNIDGGTRKMVCVTHPNSFFRMVWNVISLIMILYDSIVLSADLFGAPNDSTMNIVLGWCSQLFWTCDIGVSFFTAVYVDGRLSMDRWTIARVYVTSWLLFDIICTFPPWIDFLLEVTSATDTDAADVQFTNAFRAVRTLRYLRLFRLAKLRQFVHEFMSRINSAPVVFVAKVSREILVMLVWVHISACIWFLLGSEQGGWVHEVHQHISYTDSPSHLYFASAHWATTQLQGSTDVTPGNTLAERMYAVTATFMSVVILGTFVSRLTNLLIEVRAISMRYSQLQRVMQFLNTHKISEELSLDVKEHIKVTQRGHVLKQQETEDNEILQLLPVPMKRRVIMEARRYTLFTNPVFLAIHDLNIRCFERMCCDGFASVWFVPDQVVFNYGDFHIRTSVVTKGQLDYCKYNRILKLTHALGVEPNRRTSSASTTAVIEPRKSRFSFRSSGSRLAASLEAAVNVGQTISEAGLWVHWIHLGDLTARSHSNMLGIQSSAFEYLIESYPEVMPSVQINAKRFVNAINESQVDKSDLLTTDVILNAVRRKFKTPASMLKRKRSLR